MFFNNKPAKAPIDQISRQEALDCIPLRNPEVMESETDDGFLLRYQVEIKPWFRTIFKQLAGRDSTLITKKLQLDTLGSTVWQMVDGKHNVRQIAQRFAQGHQLGIREAEISVSAFLKDLGKRGLVAMRLTEKKKER